MDAAAHSRIAEVESRLKKLDKERRALLREVEAIKNGQPITIRPDPTIPARPSQEEIDRTEREVRKLIEEMKRRQRQQPPPYKSPPLGGQPQWGPLSQEHINEYQRRLAEYNEKIERSRRKAAQDLEKQSLLSRLTNKIGNPW